MKNLIKINSIIILMATLFGCNSGSTATSSATGISYSPFNCPGSANVYFPGVSGVRQVNGSSDVYVTGDYIRYGSPHAFLYQGPVLGGGICNEFNYPTTPGTVDVTSTSLYGPDNNGSGNVIVVGSYTTSEGGGQQQFGLLYQGASDGSTDGYSTLNPQALESSETVINTLGHSTMGGLVVGDYDTNITNGKAFIYDIANDSYKQLKIGLISTTAYGIWYNGGTNYTITGGYSDVNESGIDVGYLIDYNSQTKKFSNRQTIIYRQLPESQVLTHVEGITTDGNNGFYLSADWSYKGSQTLPVFVHVPMLAGGEYATPTWNDFMYPGSSVTSANTVYQNNVLGLFQESGVSGNFGYVATIPLNQI